MKKGKMLKRPVELVPQTSEEAAEFVRRIGEARREIDRIEATLNQEVETLKSKAVDAAKPHKESIDRLMEGIFAFAESRRDALTESGKRKTVEFTTGSIAWRMTPPAVSLRDVEGVLAELKRRRLNRFIRVKEEVDKEAMLREPETAESVKGVSIGQREEFVVKPAELTIEITSDAGKLKKAIA